MDEKEKVGGSRPLHVLTTLIIIAAVIHTSFHFALHGTGISGLGKNGVSGLAITKLGFGDDFRAKYNQLSPISSVIIIGEWSLLIILAVFALIQQKDHSKKEGVSIELKKYQKDSSKTDIDILYEILQQRKSISLATIEKTFDVDKRTVMSWCETLESSNLAKIQYPRMGGADLVLDENKNEKE